MATVRFAPTERRVVAQASVAHALTHLYMVAFAAMVMPLVRDLGAEVSDVLQAAFLGFLLFGLGGLPAGWLADRYGARAVLAANMLGCGAASCLCAVAPDLNSLALLHGLLGLFGSLYHPAGMALITRSVRRRGKALAVNGMVGNLGLAAAPLLVGVISTMIGWRAAWVALGVPSLMAGVWILVAPAEEGAPDGEAPLSSAPGRRGSLFAILCVAMTLAGLAFQGTTLAMPTFFELRMQGLDLLVAPLQRWAPDGAGTVAATALASTAYLVAVGGQALGGWVAERFDLRRGFIAMHAAAAPFAVASFWAEGWGVPLAIFGYTFFQLGMQPVEKSLVAELSPERLRGSAYGLKFVLAFGVGAFAVPAVASIEGAWGLSAVYLFVGGASMANAGIAGVLLMASARRPRPT